MPFTCIALAQSEVTCSALCLWSKVIGIEIDGVRKIVLDPIELAGEAGVIAYERLVQRIEAEAETLEGASAVNETLILVDSVIPKALTAATDTVTWEHLLAMLILTFPEVRWIFGIIQGDASNSSFGSDFEGNWFAEHHGLSALIKRARRESIFDATGLREWVRRITDQELARQGIRSGLFRRSSRACAIDEESSYAHLHGYSAYRYGFRADAVTSWALMAELFGPGDGSHGYQLLLEDMSLHFPDRAERTHILDLEDRSRHLPKLDASDKGKDDSEFRMLVTSGQRRELQNVLDQNKAYLRRWKGDRGRVVLKPVGGVLDLWEDSGLFGLLRYRGQRRGNAPGFQWPTTAVGHAGSQPAGHGAPGKLFLIAAYLVRRAETLASSAVSVTDHIKGAVLACDAAELLGGKTPTLSLAAISLKHEFEVKAECSFVGVGYNFNIKDRFRELEEEVAEVCKWYSPELRKTTALDAKVVILGKLVKVFQDHNQFDEEVRCAFWQRREMARFRQASRPIFNFLPGWLWRHLNWLLSHPIIFGLAILAWLAIGAGAYSLAADPVPTNWNWGMGSFGWSLDAFFLGDGPSSDDIATWKYGGYASWITRGLGVLGLFHFGVFLSYVYTLVSRK